MKYPIAYLIPICLSSSTNALLIFFVFRPSTYLLIDIGILIRRATGIVIIQIPHNDAQANAKELNMEFSSPNI